MILVQISRGIAPARCIAEAVDASHRYLGIDGYHLVDGLSAVEAKNEAARLARAAGDDLLLMEDDIRADHAVWVRMAGSSEPVAFAATTCRGGTYNTVRRADGGVLYSGTVFIRLSARVLGRLPERPFEAMNYGVDNGRLACRGPNATGRHSDVHLFFLLQELGVESVCIGDVEHVLHPLSGRSGP